MIHIVASSGDKLEAERKKILLLLTAAKKSEKFVSFFPSAGLWRRRSVWGRREAKMKS